MGQNDLQAHFPDSGGCVKNPEDHDMARTAAEREDPPPFFSTWNRLYVSIVIFTCVLVLILYLMTVTLNR
jgi:hypothetical protein